MKMNRGFTLVELVVVVAMILILAAAMTTSVSGARARARVSRAQAETREITNAILAYANYTDDGSLSSVTMNDSPSSESTLAFILGKGPDQRGAKVPVLYNASVTGGQILDPWGKPYRVTVKQGDTVAPPGGSRSPSRARSSGSASGRPGPSWKGKAAKTRRRGSSPRPRACAGRRSSSPCRRSTRRRT